MIELGFVTRVLSLCYKYKHCLLAKYVWEVRVSDRGLSQSYKEKEVPGCHQRKRQALWVSGFLTCRSRLNSHSLSLQVRHCFSVRVHTFPDRLHPTRSFSIGLRTEPAHRPVAFPVFRAGHIRSSGAGFIWSTGAWIVGSLQEKVLRVPFS